MLHIAWCFQCAKYCSWPFEKPIVEMLGCMANYADGILEGSHTSRFQTLQLEVFQPKSVPHVILYYFTLDNIRLEILSFSSKEKRKNVHLSRKHEFRIAVAEQGTQRPGEYRRRDDTCASEETDRSQSNFSGCWRLTRDLFVGNCAVTHMWSIVSRWLRPRWLNVI